MRANVFALIVFLTLSPLMYAQAQLLQVGYPNLQANVGLETSLLQKTNQERVAQGLSELSFDEHLALAARAHAKEMAELRYFSHSSPTVGSQTPAERVARAGSSLVFVGENIAKLNGNAIAQDALDGWMNSPGHRANILEPNYTHVGFGSATDPSGFSIVVQVFGYQPFKLINAQITQQTQTAYQIVFNARASSNNTAVFTYGEQQSLATALKAGDNAMAYLTLEQDKLYLQASVQMAEGSYLIQDGGWLDLAKGSFQRDALATQEFVSLASVTAYPQPQSVNEVLLQFDGNLSGTLAFFVDNEYQQNPNFQSGTLRLRLPDLGQNTLVGVGEVIEGNKVRIIHQVMIERSSAQIVLKGTAIR